MKFYLCVVLAFLGLNAYGQDAVNMKTPSGADKAFANFIKKEKFLPSKTPNYKGILEDELRWEVTEKVDQIGKDFRKVAALESPTDIKYNVEIMHGLGRFNAIKSRLTKADRVRICQYVIELMDIISLPSSKGQLNMFAHGFDPSTLPNKED